MHTSELIAAIRADAVDAAIEARVSAQERAGASFRGSIVPNHRWLRKTLRGASEALRSECYRMANILRGGE